MQEAKVEETEVELGKLEGKWRTEDCCECKHRIDNEALDSNEVQAQPHNKTFGN